MDPKDYGLEEESLFNYMVIFDVHVSFLGCVYDHLNHSWVEKMWFCFGLAQLESGDVMKFTSKMVIL